MKVDLFDFDLPAAFIAQRPASPRDAARLLHVPAGDAPFGDHVVRDLPRLLEPGDLMVFNDTRVIPARLSGRREREGEPGPRIEVTLHKREAADRWRAFVRPARKLRTGDRIRFADDFTATVDARAEGGEVDLSFAHAGPDLDHALGRYGAMPLPPYIRRDGLADDRDAADYQTMYAARDGAVAAPTAGLHFTPELMAALDARGIGRAFVTLHVGAGTFLPVKAGDTADHRMHAEWGEVSEGTAAVVERARANGGRVVAVGTTALRLLETAAAGTGTVEPFAGDTDLFITPGYRFHAVDRLMTNFHLPRSTLFMLVCAFAGLERMQAAYAYAKAHGYRFYSYGDACLLDRMHMP